MSFKGLGSDSNNRSMLPALVLIGLGVIGLLAGVGIFRFLGGFVWAAVSGGLAYYAYTEGTKRGNRTWRLAAFPLAGLAIAVITPASFGGAAFLAALGLAFALVWHDDKRRWWAMIPAGTFASLAAVSFFEPIIGGSAGWLFLAGLAVTFYALTRLHVDPQPWAIYPAIALGVIALLSFTTSGSWIVPLLLIGAGLFMLVRSGAIQLPQGAGTTAGPTVSPTRDEGDYLTTVPERPAAATVAAGDAASRAATADQGVDGAGTGMSDTEAQVLAEFDEPRPDDVRPDDMGPDEPTRS